MGAPVVHFEIGGRDIHKTKEFYSELFDWDVKIDSIGYGMVDTGSDAGIRGGMMQTPQGAPYVTFYVGVDDLEKYLERAETLGGTTLVKPMPIGAIGSFAMITDPDGLAVGLLKEN